MKVLHVSAAYKPAYVYGGPTMSVARLLEELCVYGSSTFPSFETEVLTTTANGDKELKVKPGETVKIDGVNVTFYNRITKDHSHLSPALIKALFVKIKRYRRNAVDPISGPPVIVHIHAWWNLVSILSCAIGLLSRSKVIISPRGTLSNYSFNNRTSPYKKIFHYLIGRSLLNKCHFHVTTEKEKRDILHILKPRSIATIPNIVACPALKYDEYERLRSYHLRKRKGLRKLLFLSRIEEKKGLDILLRALADVQFPYTLTIAGSGKKEYIDELVELVNDLKLSTHSIHWIGQQDQNAKFGVYSQHDLLILPSHDENFGNVVIESLYMGTPVLVSNKVGLSAYIDRKNLGWVCETTPESVSRMLNEIFGQGLQRLESISKICHEAVTSDFNAKTIIKQYRYLYQPAFAEA